MGVIGTGMALPAPASGEVRRPYGCAADRPWREICSGQLEAVKCRLCRRASQSIDAGEVYRPPVLQGIPGPSVQVLSLCLPSLPWVVVAYRQGDQMDSSCPIVGATSAPEAIALAEARAAQLGAAVTVVWPDELDGERI